MPTWYYRYVSNPTEVKQIVDERKIQSVNPATNYLTWYTPTRYRDVDLAQEELELPYTPTHRLGPIPDMYVVNMDVPPASLTLPMDFQGVGLKWPLQRSSGYAAYGTLIPVLGTYEFRRGGGIMNYPIIDRILDEFEGVFKEIKIKYRLSNASIERWRWDLPEIRLLWKAQDAIWRNINVLVDTPPIETTIGLMEVNAWLDVQKDNRWIRRWQHQVIVKNTILLPYSA